MYSYIINSCVIVLSLVTAVGVFVHDTKIDKAAYSLFNAQQIQAGMASRAIKNPIGPINGSGLLSDLSLHPDLHPHAERGGVSAKEARTVKSDGGGHLLQPRAREDRDQMRANRIR